MTRVAPFVLSLSLAFVALGCAAEPTSGSIDRSGRSSQNETGDDDDDAEGTIGGNEDDGASNAPSNASSASLPAPKLLPEGAVRTANACTASASTNDVVLGSGRVTRTTRDVKGFHGVGLRMAGSVIVTEGSGFAVQVETDDNLQGIVTTKLSENGNLVIDGTSSYCTNGGVKVLVTMPKIENAAIDGSGTIEVTKLTPANDVTLAVLGSGAIGFRGQVGALTALIDGSGVITLGEGSARSTKATVKGSGVVTGKAFSAGSLEKEVDGSGRILL